MKRLLLISVIIVISISNAGCQDNKAVGLDDISDYINSGNVSRLTGICDSIANSYLIPNFSLESLIDRSKSDFLSGRRNQSLGFAYSATLIFSSSADSYANMGLLLVWNNQNKDASEYFEKALTLDPANKIARYQLSRQEGANYDKLHETKTSLLGEDEWPVLEGQYLGQDVPGVIPELFAPGIISTKGSIEFACTFSPDGKAIYFTRRALDSGRNVIMVSRLGKNGWTVPDTAWFSNGYSDFEPHFSVFGDRIYFGSFRPSAPGKRPEPGIWYVQNEPEGWSDPEFLSKGMFASMSQDSLLYLGNISGKPDQGISYFNPYTFSDPILLDNEVNKPVSGQHPCISKDGSYLIFDSHREGYQGGESDLYISFTDMDGTFSKVFSLNEQINSPGAEFGACLSPDGKYLFFTRHRDIYWVSTRVFDLIKQ